ncbi:MAG: hypothetical protein M0033_10105 [Nitrospiraceae bacterium]|nr:hypothetical protein [Nitrospiraceae bacterium]
MIRIIEGVIGGGKTYYAVWHLLNDYYLWDSHSSSYVPKTDVVLVSNIRGLKLPHFLLLDEIKLAGSVEIFFTMDYLLSRFPSQNVLLVIDEAQVYFDKRFYNNKVFEFFQTHRHEGFDIYFITQTRKSLAPMIMELPEYYIRPASRHKQLLNEMRYDYIDPEGQRVGFKVLKPDKKIFALYKSFSIPEAETKMPRPLRKYVLFFFLLSFAVFLSVRYLLPHLFPSARPKQETLGGNARQGGGSFRAGAVQAGIKSGSNVHIIPDGNSNTPASAQAHKTKDIYILQSKGRQDGIIIYNGDSSEGPRVCVLSATYIHPLRPPLVAGAFDGRLVHDDTDWSVYDKLGESESTVVNIINSRPPDSRPR